jgi:hypothetical protein
MRDVGARRGIGPALVGRASSRVARVASCTPVMGAVFSSGVAAPEVSTAASAPDESGRDRKDETSGRGKPLTCHAAPYHVLAGRTGTLRVPPIEEN